MSAYFARLAQRTGLVPAGDSSPVSGKGASPLEVDIYQEIRPHTQQNNDHQPSERAGEVLQSGTPAAPPPAEPAEMARVNQAGDKPGDQTQRPARNVGPGFAPIEHERTLERQARRGVESAEPAGSLVTETVVETPNQPNQPQVAGTDSKREVQTTVDRTGLMEPVEASPSPIMAERPEPNPSINKPEAVAEVRTVEVTSSKSSTGKRSAVVVRRRSEEPGADVMESRSSPRQLTAAKSGKTQRINQETPNPTVHIGTVHMELHQSPAADTTITKATPPPRPVTGTEPRPLSLRRLYLRGW